MSLCPTDEAEVVAIVTEARGSGAQLAIRGGGTRGFDGPGTVVETTGLTGVTLYEPAEMVISARAGTPVAEVQRRLAEKGQMLPFDPMDHRTLLGRSGTPTIGAVAACNISGSRRVSSGAARDHFIGVRFVNGRGEIIKSGGRVMKNVTGLDLVKLSAGAHGTLGILTEVTFKVLPVPQTRVTLCLEGLTLETALDALTEAMATPFEVSAAACLPGKDGLSQTLMRLEGFAESCRYRFERLADHLRTFGSAGEIAAGEDAGLWTSIRDAHAFAGTEYEHVLRVHVSPSRAHEIVSLAQGNGLAFTIDWAGGLIWLGVPAGVDIENIRERIVQGGGHLIHVRGATKARIPPAGAAVQALGQRIKQAFDPDGIFNPGLLAGHI